MKFKTINQTFNMIYVVLFVLGIIAFSLISLNFSQNIIESDTRSIVFQHTVNIEKQADQVLGFALIDNKNAVQYYLESIKKEEGLARVFIAKSNPCGKLRSCLSETLKVTYPLNELDSYLIKEVSPDNLIYSDVFQYISTSIMLFLLFAVLIWLIMAKFVKNKFINIISDFKNLLSGKELAPKSSLREVRELLDENKKMIKEAEKVKIAKQVAHDIQSPLEILRSLQSDLKQQKSSNEEGVLSEAIERILAISKDLLNKKNSEVEVFNPSAEINEVIAEKLKVCSELNIIFQDELKYLEKIRFNKVSLKRILSNVLNNSIEAFAENILIKSASQDGHIVLTIEDDGHGVDTTKLDSLFTDGFTTKENGNGIGLALARILLEEFDGEITANTGEKFQIVIKLPLFIDADSSIGKTIVLIDDDEFTHLSWSRSAKDIGVELESFYSVAEFMKSAKDFKKDIPIYIDSNLGENEKGEILSKQVFDNGFKNIYLATGMSEESIEKPFWVKEVKGKEFALYN